MKNIKDWPWLKITKVVLAVLGVVIILIAVFNAGMMVGFQKAKFSFQWGDNYHRMFGGPKNGWLPPPPRDMRGDDFMNPNGVVGSVIQFDTNTLLVKGIDDVEKSLVISSSTVIMKGRTKISLNDLKTDDRVVVLGVPSSTGQIEAKLIRVFEK